MNIICDVCGSENVKKESNAILYGKEYGNGICFYCHNCTASVSTDKMGNPEGTLASTTTRRLRKTCHDIFDPIWKYERKASRGFLYKKLASKMELTSKECHFSLFQTDNCLKALSIISQENWWEQ